jgi:hypothetical protein
MKSLIEQYMEKTKYNHTEAFCHMTYNGVRGQNAITLRIWNSRDGVTPFMTHCSEYDIELSHVMWQMDQRDPNYRPKKGDLIWRDITKEEVAEAAGLLFDGIVYKLAELEPRSDEDIVKEFGYNARKHYEELMEVGREQFIKMRLDTRQRGEPALELVKEDWPLL